MYNLSFPIYRRYQNYIYIYTCVCYKNEQPFIKLIILLGPQIMNSASLSEYIKKTHHNILEFSEQE